MFSSEGPSLVGLSRRRPQFPLLSSLPFTALVGRLQAAGGSRTQAESAATSVLRHVFREERPSLDVPWGEPAWLALRLGKWSHEALGGLDPTASLALRERAPAGDGSERLLLATRDGAYVETVIIPGPGRTTVCVSSQVGCARACTFCETGRLGLTRQLDAGEIVDQIRTARLVHADSVRQRRAPPISNVVFMGMGEPFDNLEEVAKATDLLTDHNAFALPRSKVTVSTVGVADKIETFFRTCRAELAVSLNAPTDAKRSAIMPVNQRFPLETLVGALVTHTPRAHKVLFEYVLIDGFNDSLEDAAALARVVSPVRCRVNVIPLNPGSDPGLRTPSPAAVDAFVAELVRLGVTTLVRRPRGRDVGGACGQLAAERRPRTLRGVDESP
jgi:23S rRNA (adenine2503-C2)-methyltransferase